MRISDWSSDVCSSDLQLPGGGDRRHAAARRHHGAGHRRPRLDPRRARRAPRRLSLRPRRAPPARQWRPPCRQLSLLALQHEHGTAHDGDVRIRGRINPTSSGSALAEKPPCVSRRSEEHTSELQSLMRISYAVFCLKKKTKTATTTKEKLHTTQRRTPKTENNQ